MTLAEQGSYGEALAALKLSWRSAPQLAEPAPLMAARLRRMDTRNDRVDLGDLSAASPWLRRLLSLETGEGLEGSPSIAFARLGQGHLDETLTAAKGSNFESYIIKMVAASDVHPLPSYALSNCRLQALLASERGLAAHWRCAMGSIPHLINKPSEGSGVRVRNR